MSNLTPIRVTGDFTPSGTQDVNVVSSIPLVISGTVAVSNFPSTVTVLQGTTPWIVDGSGFTQPVSGTVAVSNFPGVQPVSQSGSWTVSLTSESIEIGTVDQGTPNAGGVLAWPVAVSNFPSTTAVTQSTSPWIVDGSGVIQPVSGTVSISGSVAVTGPLTDAQLRATPVPVSGSITTSPNVNVHDGSGNTIASTGTSLNVDVTNTVPVTLASTTITGSVTVIQPTGTNLHAVIDSGSTTAVTGNVTVVQPTGTNLHTVLDSGTLTSITNALPSGTNVIGHVIADTGSTTAVTGNVTVVQATGTNLHTTVDNFPATQPISGTITANQGTSPWVNNTTQLGGTDIDTNSGTKSAGTQRVVIATDQPQLTNALKVDGSAVTQPISGTVTAIQTTGTNLHTVTDTGSTTAVTGNVTVVQPTGTNLHTVLDSGTLTSITNALPTGTNVLGHIITDTGSTTAVTGTVTVAGNKTNNNAAPGATNVGVLPAIANAAVQTWTEGDQVLLSTTLSGYARTEAAPRDGLKATYSFGSSTITAAALATDIFTIYGNNTTTVKVLWLQISGDQTTAGNAFVELFLRSSANTGGTSTTFHGFKHDSNNPTSSSIVTLYSTNPTSTGTLVGSIRTARVLLPAPATTTAPSDIAWNFIEQGGQAITLRGAGEGLTVNLNGSTISGGHFYINIIWTEE